MLMINNLDGAELTVYLKDGNSFNICLDSIELIVVLKAIGFEIQSENQYNTFAPSTLEKILNGKINPFTLQTPKTRK